MCIAQPWFKRALAAFKHATCVEDPSSKHNPIRLLDDSSSAPRPTHVPQASGNAQPDVLS